jgi:peptide/nickel transport system permease protein
MSQERSEAASSPGERVGYIRLKPVVWSYLGNAGAFFRRKPLGAFGAVVAVFLIIVAIFAPLIATQDPREINHNKQFADPGSSQRLLGGDSLGRDVFSRLVYGSRVSLLVGLLSVLFGTTAGFFVGIASAYFGGVVDLIVQRIVDAMQAFPALLLALAIMAALGASTTNVIIALTIVFVPGSARTIRSQALSIKEMDYMLSARAVGAGNWRIMVRHMVPNCIATYFVLASISLGVAVIAEASLSFLGVGVSPDTPSWGGMLTGASQNYVRVAPWLGVFPGLAIATVVFAWNLLGDFLRDVLDPRPRGTN